MLQYHRAVRLIKVSQTFELHSVEFCRRFLLLLNSGRKQIPKTKPSCGVTIVLRLLRRRHEEMNKRAETQEQEG
jgi:hypothetical protein